MGETANLADMLGGSGDPGIESPETTGAGESNASEGTQAAAWTSQLSKEFRDNQETFAKVSGFKTVGELADAYLQSLKSGVDLSDFKAVMEKLGAPKEGENYGLEDGAKDMPEFFNFAKEARLTKEQAAKMVEGYRAVTKSNIARYTREATKAAPEITKSLLDEFGEAAASYYQKAITNNKLNSRLVSAGLGADKDLARALCLLGREMTEDYTPKGGGAVNNKIKTWAEGGGFSYS